MRLGKIFVISAVLTFAAFGAARAAIVGDARVSYSATRSVTVDDKSYSGRTFHIPGHQRHDQAINGFEQEVILDLPSRHGWFILPKMTTYVDFPLPKILTELDEKHLAGKAVGEEAVRGVPTTKYHLTYTASDGVAGEGNLWRSRDNILMRIDANFTRPGHRPTHIHEELSDLRLGPQDPKLFKLPPNMVKLPAEALEPLLSSMGKFSGK